jgi:hypothetical protein
MVLREGVFSSFFFCPWRERERGILERERAALRRCGGEREREKRKRVFFYCLVFLGRKRKRERFSF